MDKHIEVVEHLGTLGLRQHRQVLDHRVFDKQIAGHIDAVAVYVELMADLDDTVLVLEVLGEFVEQERSFVKEDIFGEGVVAVYDTQFLLLHRLLEHIPVDDVQGLARLVFRETLRLQRQDVVE